MKEPLLESKRFIVMWVTVGVLAVVHFLGQYVPILNTIPQDTINQFSLEAVGLVITWIAARTYRPGKTP